MRARVVALVVLAIVAAAPAAAQRTSHHRSASAVRTYRPPNVKSYHAPRVKGYPAPKVKTYRPPKARTYPAPKIGTSRPRAPRAYYAPGASGADGRVRRNEAARREFMRASGYPKGRPGYVVDHVVPLACGGADAPSNMQWQTTAEAKAKDRIERRGCGRRR